MALFRRNKNEDLADETGMPQELQDYYQAETRERTWMAWVLGLTTLVVTIIVALGLFYGGRYAYRKIRKPNNQPVAVQQNPEEKSEEAEQTEEAQQAATPSAATSTPAAATPPATTPATGDSSSQVSSSTTSTPRAATPATMPSTGPADTIAVFVAVSLLAYTAHRRFLAN